MKNFGLMNALEDYCNANNILYIPTLSDAYANLDPEMDNTEFNEDNKLILVCNLNARPTILNGKVGEIEYTGIIGLGQQSDFDEDGTIANLDETFRQKYKARLQDLTNGLTSLISEVACENELEVTNLQFRYEINKYDLNADFIFGTVTLIQGE